MEVSIDYDYSSGYVGSRLDPPYSAYATINEVTILADGVKVDCPEWLEKKILTRCDSDFFVQIVEEELRDREENR
jgi:hypothetical protein